MAQSTLAEQTAELVVCLNPLNLDFVEFIGTRAMLEAEGIIPDGTDWPQGYADVYWQAGPFDYSLCRTRPEGARGPRRAFVDVDWFCLRWELTNKPSFQERAIDKKRKELAEAIYHHSTQGQAKRQAQWDRYWKSTKDKPFQAFKAACGIVKKRRGRPCKQVEE